MRVLLDCNVVLDVLNRRSEFFASSARILDCCESGKLHGSIAWHSLSNAFYLADNQTQAEKFFTDLLGFVEVVGGDTALARAALRAGFSDMEDAMQSVLAAHFQADFIVTRNVKDFKLSPVKAMTPADLEAKFLK